MSYVYLMDSIFYSTNFLNAVTYLSSTNSDEKASYYLIFSASSYSNLYYSSYNYSSNLLYSSSSYSSSSTSINYFPIYKAYANGGIGTGSSIYKIKFISSLVFLSLKHCLYNQWLLK